MFDTPGIFHRFLLNKDARFLFNQGNGKKASYGSGSFEKHDFGDMEFNQPDSTEKDDSGEKENLNKDYFLVEDSSPLDMDDNELETKVNLESDSVPLLEKDYNNENDIEEGTQSKTNQDKVAQEKKKGEMITLNLLRCNLSVSLHEWRGRKINLSMNPLRTVTSVKIILVISMLIQPLRS